MPKYPSPGHPLTLCISQTFIDSYSSPETMALWHNFSYVIKGKVFNSQKIVPTTWHNVPGMAQFLLNLLELVSKESYSPSVTVKTESVASVSAAGYSVDRATGDPFLDLPERRAPRDIGCFGQLRRSPVASEPQSCPDEGLI